ncbi:MAG: amino acid adenylation domain-containing protein, partial [Acidobacteriota bacterium]
MSDRSDQSQNLPPQKRVLFEMLLNERRQQRKLAQIPVRSARSESGIYPLSFSQQRLWFLDHLYPGLTVYNILAAVRLSGNLDLAALEKSLNEILRRHEALRTAFPTIDGQPVQKISSVGGLDLPIVDLSTLSLYEREVKVREIAQQESAYPFNLTEAPLLRVKLIRLAEWEQIFLLTVHHIVSDQWSIDVLVKELTTLYSAYINNQPSPLAELPVQYVDFATWQRQWLQGEQLQQQLEYWRKQLADFVVLQLPTDHSRPAVQSFNGAMQRFEVPSETVEQLRELSRQQGVTVFMVLLAAFKVLLYRYSAQTDIAIGTAIAGRNNSQVEDLIGFFINTLVMRTDLTGEPTFLELIRRVRDVCLGAHDHKDLPFEKLVEELQPARDISRSPLFQVMFMLRSATAASLTLPDLTVEPYEIESDIAKFDLTLSMEETQQGFIGLFEYALDLYETRTINRMARHFQNLLTSMLANPDQHISTVPMLSDTERYQLLMEWNDTTVDYPQDKCIHQLFEEQVERTPDAIALVFEQEKLTYRELNQRANQLAHYLQGMGAGPEVLVGICLERSIEMVVAIMGVLKAGAAYLPIDPSCPKQRFAFMLADAQIYILLTQQRLAELLPQDYLRAIYLDITWPAIASQQSDNPISAVTGNNLAYLIYSSGTTGHPKGVMVEHGNLSNIIFTCQAKFSFNSQDLMPILASYVFDIFLFELINPLVAGATSLILANPDILNIKKLVDDLERVTVIHTVPALMRQIINFIIEHGYEDKQYSNIRKIFIGGDLVPIDLLEKMQQIFRASDIHELYGPTEATIICTSYPVTDKQIRHIIGKPLDNVSLRLYDNTRNLVPIGVPGEIYIAGAGISRGYLNREELTAERFVTLEGQRFYRTGDLARYLADGNIEYLGRIDDQVKIRGYRIELGEIETALAQFPTIQECVVIAREDEPGNKRLVAYLVAEQQFN